MLSVVIPVKDIHNATKLCIDRLRVHAKGDLDIIIIDNASEIPAEDVFQDVTVFRNEINVGFWPSMLQGLKLAQSAYVLMMHNDVFIHEGNFDQRIIEEFMLDSQLGAVGLFGGRGVDSQGGRGHPEGNMLGKVYGTPQKDHGHLLTTEHPAVVFDSLAICINKNIIPLLNVEDIPPHHWTDRILCLRVIKADYHCLTVGIGFDHGGSFTSATASMSNFSETWCNSKGLELNETWENTLYNYGLNMFRTEFNEITGGKSQLWVDKDFKYYVV
jgi:glycosyltransferase involved in cell wall biosynthesis